MKAEVRAASQNYIVTKPLADSRNAAPPDMLVGLCHSRGPWTLDFGLWTRAKRGPQPLLKDSIPIMPIKVAIVEDESRFRESLAILINGVEGFVCVGSYPNAETALREMPGAW